MISRVVLFSFAAVVSLAPAAIINVDLSSATSGLFIDGGGADFAQTFAGQTVSGIAIVGSPTNPLTLAPSGSLQVASFNPGVSPTANSILPQPGNIAPLSVLLEVVADSVTWTMGSGNGGSVSIDFFDEAGGSVFSTSEASLNGYNVFTYSGFGTFRGFTISDNTDAAGLRYMNFSYNAVDGGIPEPSTFGLAALGLVGLIAARRRRP